MSRFAQYKHKHKHTSSKLVFLLACAGLLGVALFADVLWFSSSSSLYSSLSIASNWALEKSGIFIVPKISTKEADKATEDKKKRVPERFVSATFADLPAPDLQWERLASAPVPRLDGAAIQIKNLFYVFAGYGTLDYVHSHVDVYNFTDNTWCVRFDMPKEMAHSHLGVASDGRYIYVVSGQYGPQCRRPTAKTFVLDTETRKWQTMPQLPAPRYAPATQLWRGRLHVMGGSKENRHTPALEHWSIAVKDGKALEKQWQTEIPIPRGGPHRATVVVNDRLLIIGGQEGDFMAKPGSPIFKCSRRLEVVYGDVYMLDDEMKWKILPPMPKPISHIEFAWVIMNNSIIITGGTTEKHPVTKKIILVGEVFQFHLDSMTWTVIGKLPFRVKTTLTGFWDGWLYFTSGQRDRGPDNPQPKKVIKELYRTKLSL
ncbi:Kelch_4 domain-containing protein/Kelch_6 domain-containing protein [Cephalotus follicularis]|uniref:Kelch_4 domain-containing protein/Kelch_6 domain-containing protein n=1 Tax=Cephalotus follicularis TaxID=3775 RepID=A0A1Q3CZU0_CEPFO|nr:Kelch_4 domain-containing protein/Kelch_6 domain-containing protein [Cephalotus follicularis]